MSAKDDTQKNLPSRSQQSFHKIRTMNDFRTGKKKNAQIFVQKDTGDNKDNFIVEDKKVTKDDIDFIIRSLKESFVFFNLSDSEFDEIIANMNYGIVKENEYIFKQEDESNSFYVIEKGAFNVEINGEIKKTLRRGASFGELGLLYNSKRSASLKAKEDCYIWGIERKVFKKVIQSINENEVEENRTFIDKINLFKEMSNFQKNSLASNLTTQKFVADQNIVNKGEKADSYYLIKQGIVSCYDGDILIRELQQGDSFGEQALYQDGLRALTVKAKTETRCLVLSKETLIDTLGENIESIIIKNYTLWTLANDSVLKGLNKIQVQRIVNNVQIVCKSGDVTETLEKKDKKITNIYMVIEGCLSYDKKLYKKGDIFGKELFEDKNREDFLLEHDLLVANAKYATIGVPLLKNILRVDNLSCIFEMNRKIGNRRKSKSQVLVEKVDIELEDLIFIKILGEGQFGVVFLVAHKKFDRTDLYALKSVSKSKIVQFGIESHIVNEKKVLEELDHPYILKLYKTFKDSKAVHFLLSFIKGIEMFDMIRQIDLFENYESKFYIGSILLCLEYLHNKNIVYRDLKPENMIIDDKGYMHLVDMGTAKKLDKGRTYTILGTPHYMAPEVIQSKGYSTMVDLWSLGICMYEFMCGFVPFGEEEEDPFNVYKLIINSKVEFPPYFLTNENTYAKQFISQLLSKYPESRLKQSYVGLKAHKWFEDFDWVG